MNGVSSSEEKFSLIVMKSDIGFKDSNCFADTSFALTSITNLWVSYPIYSIAIHSSIYSDVLDSSILSSTIIPQVPFVNYYAFPFCTLPPSSPLLLDQSVPTNIDLKASWLGESFAIEPACLNDYQVPWSTATLIDGTPLPSGLVFDTVSQTFSGSMANAGVYSNVVRATSLVYS